jgi:hypothetical protein
MEVFMGDKLANILKSWSTIKDEIQHFLKENKLTEVQKSVQKFVQKAQKDISTAAHHDISSLKKVFNKEKKHIENLVESTIKKEINKAKKFVQVQKKELTKLQKKVQSFVPKKVSVPLVKATKKAPVSKKRPVKKKAVFAKSSAKIQATKKASSKK